jgi:ribosome maturation factor RimP
LRSFLKNFRGDRQSPLCLYSIFFMDLAGEIRNLAVQNLSPDKFVVEVLVSVKKLPKRLLVIIDGDHSVNIDDCAELSRQLSKSLDDKAFFGDDNYMLEVSTPGLDHPLKLKRQYYKNIGRGMKIKFQETVTEGKLMEVLEDRIILDQETMAGKKTEIRRLEILFSEIDKAFVMVSFK